MNKLCIVLMVAIFFIAIVGTSFAAGGKESAETEKEEQVEITVLLSNSEVGFGVPEMFMDEYPNVKVNASKNSWEKLSTMATSGEYPAVTSMTQTRVARYAALGVLRPLDDLIKEYALFDESDFLPVEDGWVLNEDFLPVKEDGKRYGISKDWNLCEDYFYRKDLYKEAGVPFPDGNQLVTYEEWRENVLDKLTVREDGKTKRWAVDGYLFADITVAWRTLLHTVGADIFNEDLSRVEISNNKEAQDVLRFILDLQKDYLAPSVIDPAPTWAMPLFLNTEDDPLAIFQWGQWGLASILEEPEELIQNVGFAEGPVWSTDAERQAFHPSVGYSIGEDQSQAELLAAWNFFELITYGEWGKHRAEMGWGFPPFKSLMDIVPRDTELGDQMWRVSMNEIENQKFDSLGWSLYALFPLDTALGKHRDSYMKGDMSFQELIETIESEANEKLRNGQEEMEK